MHLVISQIVRVYCIYRPIFFGGNITHGGYQQVDANIASVRNEMSAGQVAMQQGLNDMMAEMVKMEHKHYVQLRRLNKCRVLLKKKIIRRFSLIIADILKVKIAQLDDMAVMAVQVQ